MDACRRILGAIGCVLAVAGLLLCLAVGVGVWVMREPVTARTSQLFGRIDVGLDLAEKGLEHARKGLTRAGERLEEVKEERKQPAREPRKGDTSRKLLARTVQKKVGPELDDTRQKLQAVAEAAVVVNSVLDELGSVAGLSVSGFDTERLAEINARLDKMAPAVWELSRRLGDGEPDAEADAQLSGVEQGLQTLRERVGDYQSQVGQVRQRATEIKDRMLSWITPAAILLSLICFWIALSQICILSRAWSWFRSSVRN
jgi:hypothetical protein